MPFSFSYSNPPPPLLDEAAAAAGKDTEAADVDTAANAVNVPVSVAVTATGTVMSDDARHRRIGRADRLLRVVVAVVAAASHPRHCPMTRSVSVYVLPSFLSLPERKLKCPFSARCSVCNWLPV